MTGDQLVRAGDTPDYSTPPIRLPIRNRYRCCSSRRGVNGGEKLAQSGRTPLGSIVNRCPNGGCNSLLVESIG